MITAELGRDFFIKEFPHGFELTATKLHGLIGGIEYLKENNFIINLGSATTRGGTYIIMANKDPQAKLETESDEEYLDKLRLENRTLKSQLTKLKKKLKKEGVTDDEE